MEDCSNVRGKQLPVIGSAYGLTTTVVDVYNSTSLTGAYRAAVKGIIIDCTSPEIKYPLLCSALIINGIICVASGLNPIATSIFFQNPRLIVES